MSKFITTFATTALLTLGYAAIAPAELRADMGHDHGRGSADMHHEGSEPTAPPSETPPSGGHGDHGSHSHGMLMIPAGEPIPEITVDIFPDPVAGWNLQVQTANWAFAPEAVNTASNLTEGHGHLYINGEKVTRIYSEWFHLPSLPPGEHVLTVGLNANGHEALMYNGAPIEASVTVIVPEPTPTES
ncbi:hypothetical protein [Leptolyngbya iicbica]|uniref:Uncharacterized protein n=2 Tax=Cyanophyceae TaxID=3028117 RepID=A0A4Q7E2Y7_9CYAN|nr:hypothetical protein [Leptolyngbya sp. LK]RZM75592.1 hypothetical protein DYY88_20005 [Leptolyngbya sp. LK]